MYIWKKATAEALKEIAKTLKVNKSCRHDIDGGRAKLGLGSSYPRKWENEKKKRDCYQKALLMYMSILLVGV
jgi:hypothetical protein